MELQVNNKTFENIKHVEENSEEFWYARELQSVLAYTEWRKFENVIKKAIEACENSGINAFEHFTDVSKTIKMPKGAVKIIKDYKLTRYACYLIAQNGGTMPEDLPTPKKSLKELEKENNRSLK